VIRLACYLAVVCGVSLRHIALLFAALFLIPITKSSINAGLMTLAQICHARGCSAVALPSPCYRVSN